MDVLQPHKFPALSLQLQISMSFKDFKAIYSDQLQLSMDFPGATQNGSFQNQTQPNHPLTQPNQPQPLTQPDQPQPQPLTQPDQPQPLTQPNQPQLTCSNQQQPAAVTSVTGPHKRRRGITTVLADRTNGQENIPEEQPRHSKRQALHILKEAAEIKQKPRGDSASGGGPK